MGHLTKSGPCSADVHSDAHFAEFIASPQPMRSFMMAGLEAWSRDYETTDEIYECSRFGSS